MARLIFRSSPPKESFKGSIEKLDSIAPQNRILLFPDQDIMPETMQGKLVTSFASVTVMNGRIEDPSSSWLHSSLFSTHNFFNKIYTLGWLHLVNVFAIAQDGTSITTSNPVAYSVKLAPGQVFSIPIELSVPSTYDVPLESIRFSLEFQDLKTNAKFNVTTQSYPLKSRKWNDAYKMTFIDYDKTVQYGREFSNINVNSNASAAKEHDMRSK